MKINNFVLALSLSLYGSVASAAGLAAVQNRIEDFLSSILGFLTSGWIQTLFGIVIIGLCLAMVTGNVRDDYKPWAKRLVIAGAIIICSSEIAAWLTQG